MKPDSFMPLYGNDLFAALEGYDDAVQIAYLRALWHYWHNSHCAGLPDDDEYLRRICRRELIEWSRVKGVIFGRFFKLEGGHWHQDRAREEYQKSTAIYSTRSSVGKKAIQARWSRRQKDTSGNTPSNTSGIRGEYHSEPEPECTSTPSLSAAEVVTLEIPTKDQAFTQTMSLGCPRDFSDYVYDDWAGRQGKDAAGCLVRWLAYVTKRWTRERVEWMNGTHKGRKLAERRNASPRPEANGAASLILAQNELKRIEERLKAIRAAASEDAWGPKYSPEAKAEIVILKAKQKELKSKLGFSA